MRDVTLAVCKGVAGGGGRGTLGRPYEVFYYSFRFIWVRCSNFQRVCKILSSDIFLNHKCAPKLHKITIITMISNLLLLESQYLGLSPYLQPRAARDAV